MTATAHKQLRITRTLLAACVSMGLGLSANALAQDSDADDQASAATLDTIQVTGSRIPRLGFITPSPVTVITAEDIKASGAINLGDLLNELPALAATFSLQNSSRFIGTVGLGLLDLRGIGTSRTLVLIDGRRHVGGTPGSATVDTNTIPVEFIERIEVITGGASAVYGADAVAGVVNFIMKRDIEGLTIRGQIGSSEEGGFDRKFYTMTGGSQFADGRGGAAFNVEYSEQDRLLASDRKQTAPSFRTLLLPEPDADGFQRALLEDAGLFTFSTGGVFTLGAGLQNRFIFDPGGSFRQQRFDGLVFPGGSSCQNCDFLNLNSVVDLEPDFQRGSFNTQLHFDLNENHRLVFEGKYTETDAFFLSQPSFGTNRITIDNPFLPTDLVALMQQRGRTFIDVSRFNVDAGQRGEDVKRQTARAILALEGVIFDDWKYDLSAVWGQTTEARANLANRVNDKWFAGIDAVVDPATGQVVCRSTLNPNAINPNLGRPVDAFARAGCVPFSILGDGAISPEAIEFFNVVSNSRGEVEQQVLSASVAQSSLFELPAGPVGFAAGVEWRREESLQINDPLAAAGLTFLNAIPNREGEFIVREAFSELSIPVLADLPFVEALTVDIAGRYSDYSTIGDTWAWKAGADWTVTEDLRLRWTRSKAVRAPNIGELFNPQSQNFFAINDPCSQTNLNTAPDPQLRTANCNALGLPPGFQSQINQTRPGVSGGNPDLAQESAHTTTIGAVITPRWVPGLNLSVDYWQIKVSDIIGSTSGQLTANRCVDAQGGINNEFCQRITRDPVTGEVTFVVAVLQNLSALETSGYDFEAAYTFDNVFGGQLGLRGLGTRVISTKTFPFQTEPDQFFEGRSLLGTPEWRINFNINYRLYGWVTSWETRYQSTQIRGAGTLESFQQNPVQARPAKTGDFLYHDAQVRYTFKDWGLTTYFGVDNVFDKNLPIGINATGGNSGLFDNIGRFYYGGIEYRF